MGIKKYNPTSPGLRGMTVSTFEEITAKTPEKSLTVTLKKHSGRNSRGKITVRHRGGGVRPKYRIIDFKRNKDDIPATVKTIEYDPNRSANIALLFYADGEKRYIIAPNGLKVGDVIYSGPEADIKVGNALPIANIPVGTIIHNIELKPGKGAQMVRSAGNGAQLMAKEGRYAIGKAGRKRHMGWRPTVRGSVMNPNDHPHGGGEGKAPVGRKSPVTPWGKPALGYKTRKKNKASNKYIVKRRNEK